MYTYDEAFKACLEYFNGDELAADVFLKKYALTDNSGNLLEKTPRDMHRRLAKELARVEAKYPNPMNEEEIFDLLGSGDTWLRQKGFDGFGPICLQGSPMAAVGNPYQVMSVSNCFVSPDLPLDSYGGILYTDQQIVQISKRRGGIGTDISNLRPAGMRVKNAAKTTTGIVPFMERFSNSLREVGQNNRRGAGMITCSVHHPEIREFITAKIDRTKVTGANISVRFTDEFMNAVVKGEDYEVRWPVEGPNPIISERVNAREIWDLFCETAHSTAEPGALFWDTININSPSHCYKDLGFANVSTNPCSEIVLEEAGACRLTLLNLYNFVENKFTETSTFNWKSFSECVEKAQKIMDDLVDLDIEAIDRILDKLGEDPEPNHIKRIEIDTWIKIKDHAVKSRRTGLGITALGDTIASLGMRYGSKESIEFTSKVYKELGTYAYISSYKMAQDRGVFPIYDYEVEKENEFIQRISQEMAKVIGPSFNLKAGRRNIALLTTAPAGTVSTQTQTTSGIEPAFLTSYTRRRKINPDDKDARIDFVDQVGDKWQEYTIYHHAFKEWMDVTGNTKLEDSPYYKACSNDVDWKSSVYLQAAATYWLDHSCSKTCNLPSTATVNLVKDCYMEAWKTGCKGFTVYRDGSRSGVLISDEQKSTQVASNDAPKRPSSLPCDIYHMTVDGKKWNFFVGLLDGKPYEIFAGLAEYVTLPRSVKSGFIKKIKAGKYDLCYGEDTETVIKDIGHVFDNPAQAAFTRSVSLSLRHGVKVQYIAEQLQKGSEKENNFFSLSRGLARALKNYVEEGSKSKKTCSTCGGELLYKEGCESCVSCGQSKCN